MFCCPDCADKKNQLLVIDSALRVNQGGIEPVINFILIISCFRALEKS